MTGEWVRLVQPRSTGLEPASHPSTIRAASERLGPAPVRWAVELGNEMSMRIIEAIPALGVGEDAFETLRPGPESAVIRSLLLLAGEEFTEHGATVEALEGDRDFVRRGIALDEVLRGIRLGHSLMASAMLGAVAELVPEPDATAEMKRTSRLLFEFIDAFSSSMTNEYLLERDRWVATEAAARGELVSAILRDPKAVDVHGASTALSYPLGAEHVALVLRKSGDIGPTITVLQTLATKILAERGCTVKLLIPQGAAVLWAWGARSPAGATGPAPARPADDPTLVVGVGGPCAGLSGFRQSHAEAERAWELASARQDVHAPKMVVFQDVEMVALMAGDPLMASAFIKRRLGPLAAGTSYAAEMRQTLLAYLTNERSLIRAAGQLHVARNTVAYRIKKIQDLLGTDFHSDTAEFTAALMLLQQLPVLAED